MVGGAGVAAAGAEAGTWAGVATGGTLEENVLLLELLIAGHLPLKNSSSVQCNAMPDTGLCVLQQNNLYPVILLCTYLFYYHISLVISSYIFRFIYGFQYNKHLFSAIF